MKNSVKKTTVAKAQKGRMTAKDSMDMYGRRFDSLSYEAGRKLGTSKQANKEADKDIKNAKIARAKETQIAKRLYGTTPGLPQKKKGGSVKKSSSMTKKCKYGCK
jgi:hypothetical protein